MSRADSQIDGFSSRAGVKLAHALKTFGLRPQGWVCADLGSSTGGFVGCLIGLEAARVYAIDRGYGVLAQRLRTHPRVVVMERTDALHVRLPECVDLVTIDVGWTRQKMVLPAARRLLKPDGQIVTLVKPHYEAPPEWLRAGVLPDEKAPDVLAPLRSLLETIGMRRVAETESPLRGRGGNREFLWHIRAAGA